MSQFIKKNIENVETTLNEIIILSSNDFFAFLSKESEVFFEHKSHFFNDIGNISRSNNLFAVFFLIFSLETISFEFDCPSINYWFPS